MSSVVLPVYAGPSHNVQTALVAAGDISTAAACRIYYASTDIPAHIDFGNRVSLQIHCDDGYVVIGGGYSINNPGGADSSELFVTVTCSCPEPRGAGTTFDTWLIEAINTGDYAAGISGFAVAIPGSATYLPSAA
jgi:hypothetical protein